MSWTREREEKLRELLPSTAGDPKVDKSLLLKMRKRSNSILDL